MARGERLICGLRSAPFGCAQEGAGVLGDHASLRRTMSAGLPDLHRHLDGSLRASTVSELAGGVVPVDLGFHAGMGLAAALAKFDFTLSLLQKPAAVRRVAAEMCEDAAA